MGRIHSILHTLTLSILIIAITGCVVAGTTASSFNIPDWENQYIVQRNRLPAHATFVPYPEVVYELDTSLWDDGQYNLTAVAKDYSGLKQETTIQINIQNDSDEPGDDDGGLENPFGDIPGFSPLFLIGTSIMAIIFLISKKEM